MAYGGVALGGGQPGTALYTGYGAFAIWNPTDNSISIYGRPRVILLDTNVVSEPLLPRFDRKVLAHKR